MRKALLFLLLPLLLLPAMSHAATWAVSPSGSDSAPCTSSAPCRTIARGLSVMRGGDTLLVAGGTYAEGMLNAPSGSADAPTTIRARAGETVWVQPPTHVDCVIFFPANRAYIVWDGININADGLGSYGVCMDSFDSNHHLTVRQAEITNTSNAGVFCYGKQHVFEHLHIHHSGAFNGQGPHGLYFSCRESIIRDSVIHDHQGYGFQNYASVSTSASLSHNLFERLTIYNTGFGAIWLGKGDSNIVRNNLFYNNGWRNDGASLVLASPASQIVHNTMVGGETSHYGILGLGTGDTDCTIANNIVTKHRNGNFESVGRARRSNNLETDPHFLDAAGANYRLRATSPAIDAGAMDLNVLSDRDGVVRPQGARNDIGAYEAGGVAPPAPEPLALVAPTNLRVTPTP